MAYNIYEITLYATITAAVILIFKRLFKSKLSAKWQLWIWLLLFLRVAFPALPESSVSVFNAVPQSYESTYINIASDGFSSNTGNIAAEVTNENAVKKELLKIILVCGALLLFTYFASAYCMHLYSLKNKPYFKACSLEDCKKLLGIKRNVRVKQGNAPALSGIVRPVIIIPDGYTPEEEKSIIIHELCHLKHNDIILIWIFILLLCINWFNPVIWYSFFVFRKDIEVYCDERVLKYTESKKAYASLLLKTALRKNKFIPGTTSLQNGEKEVTKRIKHIAEFKKPRLIWSIIIIILILSAAAICLTNANRTYAVTYNGAKFSFTSPTNNIKNSSNDIESVLILGDEKIIAVNENIKSTYTPGYSENILEGSERISREFLDGYGIDIYRIREKITSPASYGDEFIDITMLFIKYPDKLTEYIAIYFKTDKVSEEEILGILNSFEVRSEYLNTWQKESAQVNSALPSGASVIMNSGMSFNINTDSKTIYESEKLAKLRPQYTGMKVDEMFETLGYKAYKNQRLEVVCNAIEKGNGSSSDFVCIFNDKAELLKAVEITDGDVFTKIRMMLIQMHDVSEAQITSALYAATEDILITTFKMKGMGFEMCSITDWKESGNEASFTCTWMYPKPENEGEYILLNGENQKISGNSVINQYSLKSVIENNEVIIYQNTSNGTRIFETYKN